MVDSVGEIQRRMMELVDEFNRRNNSEVKVEVNWQYWLTNTIYAEVAGEHKYGQGWTVYRTISRDGLVLEIYTNDSGMFVMISSVHSSNCTCGE
ncbi:MAG: hypothetical protein QW373_01965 [Desulfurococcaceae archaeon]